MNNFAQSFEGTAQGGYAQGQLQNQGGYGGQQYNNAPAQAAAPQQRPQQNNAPAQFPNRGQANKPALRRIDEREFGAQYKVFGGKAAIQFNATGKYDDDVQSGVSRLVYHTVMIDAASAKGQRQYDWSNKTIIQLSQAELLELFAVMSGITPYIKFDGHGQSTKTVEAQHQGDKVFFKVIEKGKPVRAVPIDLRDAFHVANLVAGQILKEYPHLDFDSLLRCANRFVVKKTPPAQGQQGGSQRQGNYQG